MGGIDRQRATEKELVGGIVTGVTEGDKRRDNRRK